MSTRKINGPSVESLLTAQSMIDAGQRFERAFDYASKKLSRAQFVKLNRVMANCDAEDDSLFEQIRDLILERDITTIVRILDGASVYARWDLEP